MAKYIKPPYLSTHLSQNGKQAKKAGLLGSANGLVRASKDGSSVYIGNTDFTYTKYDIENDEFIYSVNEYDFFDEYEGIGVKINENKYCFLLNPYTDITAGRLQFGDIRKRGLLFDR